ncbi:aminotransferase class III-fold pyridoxal phosphate-dependent enzyme, partial [Anaerobacillus sp. 1_MG-2023]
GLYIADEVQPGFGRLGAAFWGFDYHGVQPDLVTMGKPMGNGFPMAAMATRPDYLAAFCEDTGYFNTFGGNPVAAAAG